MRLFLRILLLLFLLAPGGFAFAQSPVNQQCVASAAAGGSSDAITIPALPCALTTNLLILSTIAANTTTTPTLQPLGLTAQTIVLSGGGALVPGDLVPGGRALLNPTGTKWILLNPQISQTSINTYNLAAFGAKCDGSTDDTTAIQNWLNSAATGVALLAPAGTCIFKSPLTVPTVNGVTIQGSGGGTTTFLYTGLTATGNLFTLGSTISGCSVQNWTISGVGFRSSTAMSSGDAIRFNDVCELTLAGVVVGGFNNGVADTHFFNGVHFNGGNQLHMGQFLLSASNTGEIANGDAALQLTDLYQAQGTIFGATIGLDIAGNLGGFYASQMSELENGRNVLVSQDQVAQQNLQLFFGSNFISDATNVGTGIEFSDPGGPNAIATFTGIWLATSKTSCLKIDSGVTNWNIHVVGGNVLNCGGVSIPGSVDNESTSGSTFIDFIGTKFSQPTGAGGAPYIFNASGANPIFLQGDIFAANSNGFVSGACGGGYLDLSGNNWMCSTLDILDSSTADTASLAVSAVNNVNGVNLVLSGNGVTTPNKFLRVLSGVFDIVSSNYGATLLALTDAGASTWAGSTSYVAALPVLSSCGTGTPTVSAGSSANGGQLTVGTGTPTACTATFAHAFPNQAYCVVTPADGGTETVRVSASSKTAFTITLSAGTSSAVFNYACTGN